MREREDASCAWAQLGQTGLRAGLVMMVQELSSRALISSVLGTVIPPLLHPSPLLQGPLTAHLHAL
jgi:hypothetical protein